MSPADALDAEALRSTLAGQLIGREVIVLEQATSTNDIVAAMAATHAEGLVVFAEQQTAGRGQYGRKWESAPRKGLWLSMLLRPPLTVAESSKLTDLLATTIASTIAQELAIAASIKPPNDVYLSGGKVAGVLVEMRVEQGGGYCAVAGMGVNVNHAPDEFPAELRETATSLAIAVQQQVARAEFAAALLRNLDRRYRRFVEQLAS